LGWCRRFGHGGYGSAARGSGDGEALRGEFGEALDDDDDGELGLG